MRTDIQRNLWNLAFGGPDLKTLYIVSGKSLFSIPVNVAAHVVYPRCKMYV